MFVISSLNSKFRHNEFKGTPLKFSGLANRCLSKGRKFDYRHVYCLNGLFVYMAFNQLRTARLDWLLLLTLVCEPEPHHRVLKFTVRVCVYSNLSSR